MIKTFALYGIAMTTALFGFWKSPVTEEMLVEKLLRFGDIVIDEERVLWTEGRPDKQGKYFIVEEGCDLTSEEFNVRTRVHEYGGGSFCAKDGEIYFSNYTDQALYHRNRDGEIEKWADGMRFADGFVTDKAIYCVAEIGKENKLVRVDRKEKNQITTIHEGYDFYSSPQVSPDGTKIAFFAWNQPNMPWDGTDLILSDFSSSEVIAGSSNESIVDPKWSPDGTLHFCSDKTGWWNLYKWEDKAIPLCPMNAEIGHPLWVFGESDFTFVGDKLYAIFIEQGVAHLGEIRDGKMNEIALPLTDISHLYTCGNRLIFFGAGPETPRSLFTYDLKTKKLKTLREGQKVSLSPEEISKPQEIVFPTTDGKTAYGFYYPPTNSSYIGKEGKSPPLMVNIHGGPTARAKPIYNISIQYWTSRGFAYFDLNYGGSTGYGTEYRRRLNGNWGVVDVDDAINGALYLADQGLADKDRLTIRGGSAGGYTTLAALAFRNVFAAGACYYGLSDLELMVDDDHKFESRYSDTLIGPYPKRKELYKKRSPIHYIDRIQKPLIVFHGDEDRIVPHEQADIIVEALRAKGIDVPYFLFKGEQHGFRIGENIKTAHREECAFYQNLFSN